MQRTVNVGPIERLEQEIAYRELLLEEVIHRIKNQLFATIIAIDEEVSAARSPGSGTLVRRIKSQLVDLAQSHSEIFGAPSSPIGDVSLPRHQEITLTLILRELIANTCKHAFPGSRLGTVIVNLGVDGHSCRLRVYDDGIGCEPDTFRTTGLQLVTAFARGLCGRFDIRSECGTIAELHFPLRN